MAGIIKPGDRVYKNPVNKYVFFILGSDEDNTILYNGTSYDVSSLEVLENPIAVFGYVFFHEHIITLVRNCTEAITITINSQFQEVVMGSSDIAKAVQEHSDLCPYCGSTDKAWIGEELDTPELTWDTKQLDQVYQCSTCAAQWKEKFEVKFKGVE
jgi:DNA-directed RNA polymerase subunit RPC12/RpoP